MDEVQHQIRVQRSSLLRRLENRLELPMAVLGLLWLLVVMLALSGLTRRDLTLFSQVVWVLFLLDFLLKLLLAPDRRRFLRRNWLTVLSLALPALRGLRALRMLRALRAARVARGLRLLRLLTSINRGVRALGRTLRRRGFGYVLVLTVLVGLAGAAGILALEQEGTGGGAAPVLRDYGDALWWTAMLLVTMGSDYWPRTAEGRLLCILLAVYGFSMFGYVTATLASFFVSRDAEGAALPAPAQRGAERTG